MEEFMQTAFIIGLPVIVILLIVTMLKLKPLSSYISIIGLGVLSSFIVEFVFCSVLKIQCEPDALNAVGLFFHSLFVIAICSVIYAIMPLNFKRASR
jgi:predicted membrane channel-forming protein YqfA (hemolysin III family)